MAEPIRHALVAAQCPLGGPIAGALGHGPRDSGRRDPRGRRHDAALRGHGPLMFHQSGGCCDGSSPMCYLEGEFRTGQSDVLLGSLQIDGVDEPITFWMSVLAVRAAGSTPT